MDTLSGALMAVCNQTVSGIPPRQDQPSLVNELERVP